MLRLARHRRPRASLAWLAITALLWSQMLLAFHADCPWSVMPGMPAEAAAEHADCTQAADATDLAVCQSHCSQGDASPDSPRSPSVPALAPVVPAFVVAVIHLGAHGVVAATSQHSSTWHRPTAHPASVLLI